MDVQTVPGGRRGSIYYFCEADRGYFYRINKSTSGKKFLICVVKDCPARACCDDFVFTKLGEGHNHLCDVEKEKCLRLKNDMVKEAASTSDDIKSIFVQKSSSASRDVASKIAFPAVAKSMRRERRQVQPPMPDTLQQFGEFCQHSARYGYIDNEVFCRGASGTGNLLSIIFLAEGLVQLLKETKEVHIDGTFKTRPRHPASSQLLTIMAVQYGYALPCAFALMASRKTEAYDELFKRIKEIVPEFRPKVIMTDFELALTCSLKKNFPEAQMTGCFFHYCQAILRKSNALGMRTLLRENRFAKNALKMLMCVALLPTDKIDEGSQYVRNYVQQNNIEGGFQTLLLYHRRQWLERVGADSISVFNRMRRTNNDSESFHSALQSMIRIRGPNIWEFVDKIRSISAVTIREIQAFTEEGLGIRVLPKRSYRLTNRRIKDASSRLEEDNDVPSFLKCVSYTVERMFQVAVADNYNEEEQEEFLLAPLTADVPSEFQLNMDNAALNENEDDVNEDDDIEEDNEGVTIAPPVREGVQHALCLVCQLEPPTLLLLPCNHLGMCTECAETMQRMSVEPQRPDEEWGHIVNYGICPLDRIPIAQYVRVVAT